MAEIAVRLRLSEQTVRSRAAQAETLRTRCPESWRTFIDGRTSERHAIEIARLARTLPDDASEGWNAFDRGAAERAERLTPARFAVSARTLRERVHAESLDDRHRRAAKDRGVWLTPELDGMATLSALMPADRATAAMSRLDQIARHLVAAADEERTLAQRRADALADLLTAEASAATDAAPVGSSPSDSPSTRDLGDAHGRETRAIAGADRAATADRPGKLDRNAPRGRALQPAAGAHVVVTVPALTLLGANDDPATLDGYGPIDLDTARRLAGGASSWTRVLTHPLTGVPLALDRTAYRVTAAMRRWLGITSPTCIFPGCGRAARACDIDHLTAWAEGGATDVDHLEPECRHHHRLRHETKWTPSRDPLTGDVSWVSPRGYEADVDPPPF